jgi:membrane fusion protein (multidrug efflux system)
VAVLDMETEQSVFVVEGDLAHRRNVRLGYPKGDRIEVLEGLTGDEQLVVIGQTGLKDGAKVEVIRRGQPVPSEEVAEADPGSEG